MCPRSATQNHIFGKPDYHRNGRTGHVNVRGHRRPHAHHYLELRHPCLHRGRTGNTKRTGMGSPHCLVEGPGARRVVCSSWSYRQTREQLVQWWSHGAPASGCFMHTILFVCRSTKRGFIRYEIRRSGIVTSHLDLFLNSSFSKNGSDVVCVLKPFANRPSGVSISWSSSSHDTICNCWYVKKTCMVVKLQYYCNSSWQEKWWWMSSKNCLTFALFHNLVLLCAFWHHRPAPDAKAVPNAR